MASAQNTHPHGPDILLVNPWIYDFAAYDLWAKPLGLLYIASVFRDNGYRVHLIDCLHHNGWAAPQRGRKRDDGQGKFPKEIVPKPAVYRHVPRRYGRYGIPERTFFNALEKIPRPAAILVTSGMTYWYPGVFHVVELLRRRFHQVPILLGGIYATLCQQHAVEHSGADVVIAGPGETTALAATDRICGWSRPPCSYEDLDAIPFPAFDLYEQLDYACLLTSRGCPRRCTYCASHLLSPTYRRRSVENVLAELEWLCRGLGVRSIALYDDALLVDADGHIKPILEGVIRRGWEVSFHTPNGLHLGLVDRELAHLMRRSGFNTVRLSLETADEAWQRRLGFKVSRRGLVKALEHLESAGFERDRVGVYLLAGLPGQGAEQIRSDVDFVTGLGAQAKLALYSPIPGTAEWHRAVQCGLVDPQEDPLGHNNTTLPYRSLLLPAEEIEKLKLYAHRRNERAASARRFPHGVPTRAEPDHLQLHL